MLLRRRREAGRMVRQISTCCTHNSKERANNTLPSVHSVLRPPLGRALQPMDACWCCC